MWCCLAEIKKRLSEIVDGVEGRHDRVVLTRHGRPAAVITSPDELESLEETLGLSASSRWSASKICSWTPRQRSPIRSRCVTSVKGRPPSRQVMWSVVRSSGPST